MSTIGPINLRDWNTLKMLKRSINTYESNKRPKFKAAYDLEISLYNHLKSKYVA